MSPTQTPKYFKVVFKAIMEKMSKLESQDVFTARDLAIAQELCRQYSDVLLEMEEANLILDTTVTAKVNNKLITFENTDDFTAWMAGVMQ